MCHGLPTTHEEFTVFKLGGGGVHYWESIDLWNNNDVFKWICEYGPMFIDQFFFLCETDMGHGAETHVIYFDGLEIYIGQGTYLGLRFIGIHDLPDAFANVKTEHVLI